MSSAPKPPTISQFTNLSSAERLSYLQPLLPACSHGELLSVQATLTRLFHRDFIQLPLGLVVRILKYLNLKDIISCMLVSRSWYNAIHCTDCRTLWRMHSVQLASEYNKISCLTNDNVQWKRLCQLIKSFQNKLIQNFAYRIKPIVRKSQDFGNIQVFRVFSSGSNLAIHGYSDKLSTEVILVWKMERGEFIFKKDLLEGSYGGTDSRTLSASQITISLHDKFLLVAHMYLDIFEMDTLSLTSRIHLPSMSDILHIDSIIKEGGNLHLIAILFSDFSIYVLDPSNGKILKNISIQRNAIFHFSILPLPSLLVFSDIEFKILNLRADKSFQRVTSLQHHFTSTSVHESSFQLSKDKELAAILYDKVQPNAMRTLYLYETSNWRKIKELKLNLPTFYEYSVHSVGNKYVVLLSQRRRLELVICDVQGPDSMVKSVIFNEITAYPDAFAHNNVILLSDRWLKGLIYEEITDTQNKEVVLPMFLILTGITLSTITTLFLHC